MSKRFLEYYNRELEMYRVLQDEFVEKHPKAAPFMRGPNADEDVERLTQSAAFQTARIQMKLDDDYPEIIQPIIQALTYYLRPIPAISTVAFAPDNSLDQPETISAGTAVHSVPVDEKTCRFATCYDVEVHPLSLNDACFEQDPGQPPRIRLTMMQQRIKLNNWNVKKLRFFLAGEYAEAADLYYLFMRHLKRITINPLEGGAPCGLEARHLQDAGFSRESVVIPSHPYDWPVFRVLQEYIIYPEKFLYIELNNINYWRDRGNGNKFEIVFEFDSLPIKKPTVTRESFALYSTPVINIFNAESVPFVPKRYDQYTYIKPAGEMAVGDEVYCVEKVIGSAKGEPDVEFAPFLSCKFQWEYPAKYRLFYTQSIVKDYPGTYINLDIPKDRAGNTSQYTINMSLKCTNGRLPEKLRLGDICEYAAGSPQFATFKNIKPIAPGCCPSIHDNALWHVFSHRKMHHFSLKKEALCSLLKFYTFPDTREIPASFADQRRIDGIKDIKTDRAKAIIDGALTFGREVKMRLSRAHYRSLGDMYLFGCVLDYFVSGYATDLSFTRFSFVEEESGREYKWPHREGLRRSI